MAYRKDLLTVSYHYDDDSGIYSVGEIDFGISAELSEYIRRYGKKGVRDILYTLSYLMHEVLVEEGKAMKEAILDKYAGRSYGVNNEPRT
ncbi:MAG: hypothetical protein DRO67_02030 [Candidatus Asgardarchaeum californiense]|nr:MAG: hypothetical protein DRO67_02030 [Candidatus Asgardarchaeum californiense]